MPAMSLEDPIALVRCRLDGPNIGGVGALRYVPLAEYGLWTHLMRTRHHRKVTMEAVSMWIPEDPALWTSGFDGTALEPILRFRIDVPGPAGATVPVERFFRAESYPVAQEALLSHYPVDPGDNTGTAVAGYFLPPAEAVPVSLEDPGETRPAPGVIVRRRERRGTDSDRRGAG